MPKNKETKKDYKQISLLVVVIMLSMILGALISFVVVTELDIRLDSNIERIS